MPIFGYAGPVIGIIAWNLSLSLIGVICVYIYLHRAKLKKYKILAILTKPLHKSIKRIAKKRINAKKK